MSTAHQRAKQPLQVRRALLDSAIRIAGEQGLAAVTVQAVATAAGVTKGGLFHHFDSKQAMLEAVVLDLIEQLAERIESLMAEDQGPGVFTRAYVRAILDQGMNEGDPWRALGAAVVMDPTWQAPWADWLLEQLARHAGTDADPRLEVVRLAADGAWLAFMGRTDERLLSDRVTLRERMLAMSRITDPAPPPPTDS